MKVIDLFCGCGGFSKGFEKNGFDVLGVDIWDIALKSHGGNTICTDVSKITRKDFPTDYQNPNIVIGSPPCQTFSTANSKRTKDDTLIRHFERLVKELNPQYWIWENVMGSRSRTKGVILDAQDFGVAQRRKRNFVSNIDLRKIPKNTKKVSIREAFKNNLGGNGILDGFNSKIYSVDSVSPTIRRIPLKWYDGRYDNTSMPSPLRFTGFKMLSIEEHLILMGFDENFKLYGNKGEKMLQIGNSVSPAVSDSIAKYVKTLCI